MDWLAGRILWRLRILSPAWAAVRVLCGKEISIEAHLQRRAIATFLPTHRVRRRWSDRTKTLEQALFQGYLFAQIFPFEANAVVTTPGVMEILSLRGVHIEIEPGLIDCLRARCDEHGRMDDGLSRGTAVKIIGGPYAGFIGRIEKAQESGDAVTVLMDQVFGKTWHIEASRCDLKPLAVMA